MDKTETVTGPKTESIIRNIAEDKDETERLVQQVQIAEIYSPRLVRLFMSLISDKDENRISNQTLCEAILFSKKDNEAKNAKQKPKLTFNFLVSSNKLEFLKTIEKSEYLPISIKARNEFDEITKKVFEKNLIAGQVSQGSSKEQELMEIHLEEFVGTSVKCFINRIDNRMFAIKQYKLETFKPRSLKKSLDQIVLLYDKEFDLLSKLQCNLFVHCNAVIDEVCARHITFSIIMPKCIASLSNLFSVWEEAKVGNAETFAPWFISVLMREVFDAVELMHEHNLMHRHLKPSNILLSFSESQNSIKIADSGLIVSLDDEDCDCVVSEPKRFSLIETLDVLPETFNDLLWDSYAYMEMNDKNFNLSSFILKPGFKFDKVFKTQMKNMEFVSVVQAKKSVAIAAFLFASWNDENKRINEIFEECFHPLFGNNVKLLDNYRHVRKKLVNFLFTFKFIYTGIPIVCY